MASGILLMFVLHNTVSKHIRPNVEVIRAFSLEGAVLAKAISRLVRGTGVVVTPPQRRYAFLFLQNYLGMEVGPTSHVASMERLRQLLVGKRFHISLHRYKLLPLFSLLLARTRSKSVYRLSERVRHLSEELPWSFFPFLTLTASVGFV